MPCNLLVKNIPNQAVSKCIQDASIFWRFLRNLHSCPQSIFKHLSVEDGLGKMTLWLSVNQRNFRGGQVGNINTQRSTLSVLTSKSAWPKICLHLCIYFFLVILTEIYVTNCFQVTVKMLWFYSHTWVTHLHFSCIFFVLQFCLFLSFCKSQVLLNIL